MSQPPIGLDHTLRQIELWNLRQGRRLDSENIGRGNPVYPTPQFVPVMDVRGPTRVHSFDSNNNLFSPPYSDSDLDPPHFLLSFATTTVMAAIQLT